MYMGRFRAWCRIYPEDSSLETAVAAFVAGRRRAFAARTIAFGGCGTGTDAEFASEAADAEVAGCGAARAPAVQYVGGT